MSTPGDPQATDATRTQEGTDVHDRHVPEPASGVRGADAVDGFDAPGEGTTTGADGQTPAREALRSSLGERSSGAGTQDDGELEQSAAVGPTDLPPTHDSQGASIQGHGSRP